MIELLILYIAIGCLGFALQTFVMDMAYRFNVRLVKPFSCAFCFTFWLAVGATLWLVSMDAPITAFLFAGVSAVVANWFDARL